MKNWIKYLFLIVIILGPLAYIIFFPASPANDILLKWVSSWPVFVLIAIFLFYEEIVKKIRELLKYEGPAGKAEWVGQKDVKEADTTKIEGEIKDLLIIRPGENFSINIFKPLEELWVFQQSFNQ